MKTIYTNNAPAIVGPYSQAIEVNGFIFCAGQIGIDPKTSTLVEGIENQTKQVMTNIAAVLTSAGVDLSDVVKTTIFVKSLKDYVTVNEIYGSYFTNQKPARSTVEVSCLPKDALVEIEVIAIKK